MLTKEQWNDYFALTLFVSFSVIKNIKYDEERPILNNWKMQNDIIVELS